MKIKLVFIILLYSLMFSQCKKETTTAGTPSQPDCVKNNTGIVYFKNKYSDPYKLEINVTYVGTVSGGSTSAPTTSSPYTTSAGSISYKATQASGYIFYPDVYPGNSTVTQCGDLTITF